jgi:hypothetical protein
MEIITRYSSLSNLIWVSMIYILTAATVAHDSIAFFFVDSRKQLEKYLTDIFDFHEDTTTNLNNTQSTTNSLSLDLDNVVGTIVQVTTTTPSKDSHRNTLLHSNSLNSTQSKGKNTINRQQMMMHNHQKSSQVLSSSSSTLTRNNSNNNRNNHAQSPIMSNYPQIRSTTTTSILNFRTFLMVRLLYN